MANLATNLSEIRSPVMPGPLSRLFHYLVAWNQARQTRDELMKLNDRELDDIGLCRGDIDRIAASVFRA